MASANREVYVKGLGIASENREVYVKGLGMASLKSGHIYHTSIAPIFRSGLIENMAYSIPEAYVILQSAPTFRSGLIECMASINRGR